MVRLYGPLMSLDASGTIADAVTFSKWKGRNYARQRVIPANPQAALQVGTRAMLAGLSKAWTLLSATQKGYWDDLGKASSISPFNAFVQFNQLRFGQFKPPVYNPDDTNESGAVPTGVTATFTAGVRSATAVIAYTAPNTAFTTSIFRSLVTPVVIGRDTLVYAFLHPSDPSVTWVDTPLAAGTYYYWAYWSLHDGNTWSNIGAQSTVVIT